MTQLGDPLPQVLEDVRSSTESTLKDAGYDVADADSLTTGRDFLLKIWQLVLSVPVGFALLHEDMRPSTIANIFYEMGLMQAYGKETLIIKTEASVIPSDFVRTEYIQTGKGFKRQLRQFLGGLPERADYYAKMAGLVENNPLLSIDYYRRAYLLTGDDTFRDRAKDIFESSPWSDRAKNSVEMLSVSFISDTA